MWSKVSLVFKDFKFKISEGYSHLSNKRGTHAYQFEKFHPPQNKNPPSTFIDFLDFSTPSTPHLLELCTSFFQKIPTSTFSDLATFAPPSCLFQSPSLLKRWEYATLKRVGPHYVKVSKVVGDCFDLPGDSWLIILLALVDDEEHHQKKSDDDIEHQVPPHCMLIWCLGGSFAMLLPNV